jgi:hypothetical protein
MMIMTTTKTHGGHSYLSRRSTQSLVAHVEHIETDSIMNKSDYLVINETWMDDATPVNVSGFQLKACNTALERRQNQLSTSSPLCKRPAGGAAIYRNLNSLPTVNVSF